MILQLQSTSLLKTSLRHLLLCGDTISSHSLDTLCIEDRLDIIRVLVFKSDVAFFRKQHTWQIDLLELELDWCGVHRRDRVCNVVPDPKGLFFGLTAEVDEQRIGIAIYDFCTPFWCGINVANGLHEQWRFV